MMSDLHIPNHFWNFQNWQNYSETKSGWNFFPRSYCSHKANRGVFRRRSYWYCYRYCDKNLVLYRWIFVHNWYENQSLALLDANWLSLFPTSHFLYASFVSVFLVKNYDRQGYHIAEIIPLISIRLKGGWCELNKFLWLFDFLIP